MDSRDEMPRLRMNDHTPDAVGVDVPEAHLDVHRRATGEQRRRPSPPW